MANRTFFSAVQIFHRNQYGDARLVAFLFLCFCVAGCSASRPSFNPFSAQAPTVRRSTKPVEPKTSTAKKETSVEPSLAANIALNSQSVDESNTSRTKKNDSRTKSSGSRSESLPNDSDSPSREFASESESNNPTGTSGASMAETGRIEPSFDRFGALSNEFPTEDSLPQGSLTSLAERLRIDSLIWHAKQLLESGQLEQAVQKAQQAQDLSDKVQIDYAPDEDRPIDLVRRIQGQLEATRLKDESNSGHGLVDSPASPINSDKADVSSNSSQPAGAPTKDPSSLARIRRDWSTLFRQKKKQANQEQLPANQNSEPDVTPPATDPIQSDQQVLRNAKHDGPEAIVMANRSVSLGATEPMMASSVSYVIDTNDLRTVGNDSTRSDSGGSTDFATPDFHDSRENPIRELVDATRPILDTDELGDTVSDFNVTELAVPLSTAKFSVKEKPKPEINEPSEIVRESDWTGLYLGIVLSGLLAVSCIRRGTT